MCLSQPPCRVSVIAIRDFRVRRFVVDDVTVGELFKQVADEIKILDGIQSTREATL